MITLTRPEIEALINLPAVAVAICDAYVAASKGAVNLPPVGHITFPDKGADCHIKYGHLRGSPRFVIKIATGFPQNAGLGLQTGNGVVLVLSARTGEVEALLQDEMVLTDIRTGIGGAIASRCLARADSRHVLVVGTGPQARRQIEAHGALMNGDLSFQVWGRDVGRAGALVAKMSNAQDVTLAADLEEAVGRADIIVTATGSTGPLIRSDWVRAGTHITAVGADAPGKQELDIELLGRADVIAVDLRSQCVDHGEVSHAVTAGRVAPDALVELGTLLAQEPSARTSDAQITMADLTGIAAQDIAIANAVLEAWETAS